MLMQSVHVKPEDKHGISAKCRQCKVPGWCSNSLQADRVFSMRVDYRQLADLSTAEQNNAVDILTASTNMAKLQDYSFSWYLIYTK